MVEMTDKEKMIQVLKKIYDQVEHDQKNDALMGISFLIEVLNGEEKL